MKTKFILTFFLVIILFLNSNAQGLKAVQKSDSTDCKAWGVNVSFGSALFYGDLKQYELYPLGKSNRYAVSERKTAYAIAVNKDFGRIFSIQGQLIQGNLAGDVRKLNRYFEADFMEFGLTGTFNFCNLLSKKDHKFNVYGLIGFGYMSFHSISRNQSFVSPSSTDKFIAGEGYDNNGNKTAAVSALTLPLGIGFNYKLTKNFIVNIETSFRNSNSDKIDTYEGGSRKDRYQYSSVGLTYKFNFVKEAKVNSVAPAIAEQKKPEEVKPVVIEKKKEVVEQPIDVAKTDTKEPIKEAPKEVVKEPIVETKPIVTPAKEDKKLIEAKNDKKSVKTSNADYSGIFPVPSSSVLFDFNSSVINKEFEDKIEFAVNFMNQHPEARIILEGHCDKVGGEAINKKLGAKRSNAVKRLLIDKFKIEAKRISIVSKGKNELLSQTDDKINRRVDFKVVK